MASYIADESIDIGRPIESDLGESLNPESGLALRPLVLPRFGARAGRSVIRGTCIEPEPGIEPGRRRCTKA
jgi:hypothetical protein